MSTRNNSMTGGRVSGSTGSQRASSENVPLQAPPPPTHQHDKIEMMNVATPIGPLTTNYWKWVRWILAALVIIGLILGLALGLTIGKNHGDGDSGSSSSPPPPTPTCTANCSTGSLPVNTPWQIVLSETLTLNQTSPFVSPNATSDPGVSLYDIDMFLHQNLTVVRELQAQGTEVICYFSAGSYEPGRPDSWKFNDDDKGKELDGWPGEFWLDLNSNNVRQIMVARIEIAARMNCSGIDPDNVDGYDNENGLGLTQDDSISFMKFLAQEAQSRGLMIGLKNAGDIIDDVIDYVQFSVNEQCSQYDECDTYAAFPKAGKPVFHIEYPDGTDGTVQKSFDTNKISTLCKLDNVASTEVSGFNTVLKNMNLDGFVQYCDEKTFITAGS